VLKTNRNKVEFSQKNIKLKLDYNIYELYHLNAKIATL